MSIITGKPAELGKLRDSYYLKKFKVTIHGWFHTTTPQALNVMALRLYIFYDVTP